MRVHFKTKEQSKTIKDKKREKEVLKKQRVRSRMNTVSDIQSLPVLIKFLYKKCTLTLHVHVYYYCLAFIVINNYKILVCELTFRFSPKALHT